MKKKWCSSWMYRNNNINNRLKLQRMHRPLVTQQRMQKTALSIMRCIGNNMSLLAYIYIYIFDATESQHDIQKGQRRMWSRKKEWRQTIREKSLLVQRIFKVHAVLVESSRYCIWIKVMTTRELIMRTIVSVQFMIKTDMKEMRLTFVTLDDISP